MKYVKQFAIIAFISLIGEGISHLVPLPIPASIYGVVLMFICLEFKIIPLNAVKETGMFLRRGTLKCQALFLAEADEENATFLDFRLKGDMTD